MNGVDKIAGKIAEDAKLEIDAILADAGREAAAIADSSAALAKEESARILAAGREQAGEIGRRAASAADQERKQLLLATKQNMIAKAFAIALDKVRALPEQDYIALLARLAAEASSTGAEALTLSAKDLAGVGQKVLESANQLLAGKGKAGSLTLSPEAGAFDGGLLLKAGDVEVNCSLEAILRLTKEELTFDVATALFS